MLDFNVSIIIKAPPNNVKPFIAIKLQHFIA